MILSWQHGCINSFYADILRGMTIACLMQHFVADELEAEHSA